MSKTPIAEIVERWRRVFDIDISEEMKGVEEVETYRCNETGLIFFAPLAAAGSERMYADLQKISWYYTGDKWEHRATLEMLKRTDRVLEVGCGKGDFVAACSDRGIAAEGIEFSAAAVEAAKAMGRPVRTADLIDVAAASPGAFDAVCAFQVVEHVADILGFIQGMVRAVRVGGLVFIGVPDCGGYLRYTDDPLNIPPHHMSQWNARAFRSLARLLPMSVETIRYEPLPEYRVPLYLDALVKRYQPGFIGGLLDSRVGRGIARRIIWRSRRMLRGQTMLAVFRRTS